MARQKKKNKKNQSWLWWAIGCAFLIILLFLTMIFYHPLKSAPTNFNVTMQKETYETVDIKSVDFLHDNVTSLDINIAGVAIGDSMQKVRATLGEHDGLVNDEQTQMGQENWRYSVETLGIGEGNSSAIIIHFDNGYVKSINVQKEGVVLLSDDFDFTHKPSDYFALWGSPQIDKDLAWIGMRKLVYTQKGVELYFFGGTKLNTISFTYPL